VIGQFVVGENASRHNIRTHDSAPSVPSKVVSIKDPK
jgi:hypothetical protein